MKFGTGSNAERTQKYGGSKYKMTYIRPNIYINKQISPISIVLPLCLTCYARSLIMPSIEAWFRDYYKEAKSLLYFLDMIETHMLSMRPILFLKSSKIISLKRELKSVSEPNKNIAKTHKMK